MLESPCYRPGMRVFDFNSAIVRLPGRSVVNGLRTGGSAPLHEKIVAEHAVYVEALRALGIAVTLLEPLESHPDSIFVEDPALVFSEAALLLRPGAPTRLGEAQLLAPTLAAMFPRLLQLREGHADGGDVLVTPARVYIGLSARTDQKGATALQSLLGSIGRESRVVSTPSGTLHLKSDCSLVDEETILATAELANSGLFAGFRVLVAPREERAAVNAVRVNDVMLMREDCPRTAELLVSVGVKVVTLPGSEIAKIDAGLSCMSLRWFRENT